jgi:serine/threonine-protein kinase
MGVVYKAYHSGLKRTVALKVLIAGEDASEEAIARFHREAEAVAKLGLHPNIVPVYDIGMEGRLHFFAMHFVEGRSLDRLIDDGEITPKRAASIAWKIAAALHHAHQHGILHRDIKPSNILMTVESGQRSAVNGEKQEDTSRSAHRSPFTPELEPLLTDFGLAKDIEAESQMTRTGMAIGTPHYMSPEQASGRPDDVDERSDIFALGSTLYEMLAMQPPFEGRDVLAITHKVKFEDPVSPRKRNPLVSRDLETICLKCMEKDPAKRYASAKALEEDLGRYLEGAPILARPVPAWERLLRRVRRNKALTAVIFLVAVLVLGGATGVWIAREQLKAQQTQTDVVEEEKAQVEQILEKSRKAMRVLLLARERLRKVQLALKKSYHDSTKGLQEKRDVWAKWEKEIDQFGASLGSDSVSRSTMLGVKGWLLHLGGYEEKAFDHFNRSRDADPDVILGLLFEGMVWLTKYISTQPLPTLKYDEPGTAHGEVSRETPRMKKVREQFEGIAEQLVETKLWDPSVSEDFRKAFQGLLWIHSGNFTEAEMGLSKGLSLPELVWVHEEILIARARVRYLRKAYKEGLSDIQKALETHPRNAVIHYLRGDLLHGRVLQEVGCGGDPSAAIRGAVQAYEKAVSLDREDPATGLNRRAYLFVTLGRVLESRGEDPRPYFRRAIADATEALRIDPEYLIVLNNRAYAWIALGKTQGELGEDPTGSYEKAIQDCRNLLARNPASALALGNLGVVHFRLGKWLEGIGEDPLPRYREALEKAEEKARLDPKDPSPLVTLAVVHLSIGEVETAHGKDPRPSFRRAVEHYTGALHLNPNFASAYRNRAWVYAKLGKAEGRYGEDPKPFYQKALEDCREALARNPEDPDAHNHRGLTYWYTANEEEARGKDPIPWFQKAVKSFTETLKRNPVHATALSNRGGVHLLLGEALSVQGKSPESAYRQAVEDLGKALERNPAYLPARNNLGTAYSLLGDTVRMAGKDAREYYRHAEKQYGNVLTQNPKYARAYTNRASTRRKLGEAQLAHGEDPRETYRRGIQDCAEALRRNPENTYAFLTRGGILHRLGEAESSFEGNPRPFYEKAVADFGEVLRREPGNVAAHTNRGNAYVRLGVAKVAKDEDPREDYTRAVAEYDEALKGNPKDANAHYNRGVALWELGLAMSVRGKDASATREKAMASMREAWTRNRGYLDAAKAWGRTLMNVGRFEEAMGVFRDAKKIRDDPSLRSLFANTRALATGPAWRRLLARGINASIRGDWKEARKDITDALAQKDEGTGAESKEDKTAVLNGHFTLSWVLAQASIGKTAPLAVPKAISEAESAALRKEALTHLQMALELGWVDFERISMEPRLGPLRSLPAFQTLVKEWREREGK